MSNEVVFLRALRERRGYTQVELAERSGVEQTRISKLETRRRARPPDFATVTALADALGVKASRLRFGPDTTVVASALPRASRKEASA